MTAPRRHRPTLAELDALEATWEAYLLDAEDAEDAFDNLGAAILAVLGRDVWDRDEATRAAVEALDAGVFA